MGPRPWRCARSSARGATQAGEATGRRSDGIGARSHGSGRVGGCPTRGFALYLDTSALLKLFIDEDGSAEVRALARGRAGAEVLLVSQLGYTEASVSLARMVHLGGIPAADCPITWGRLNGTGTSPSRKWR